MAIAADPRSGVYLDIDGQCFFIVEFLHVRSSKGPTFTHTRLRNIVTGRIIDKMWNSGVKVEGVCIERRSYQYLYNGKMGYHFIRPETFDQIAVNGDLTDGVRFLKEGGMVETMVYAKNGTVLTCELPAHIDLRITHAGPGIGGDTVTNSLKPATAETGAGVHVPFFISQDDLVTVDARDGSYVGYVKE